MISYALMGAPWAAARPTVLGCHIGIRKNRVDLPSRVGSTGSPMWTLNVSAATKRIRRVHCCTNPMRQKKHQGARERRTVLIGAIFRNSSLVVVSEKEGKTVPTTSGFTDAEFTQLVRVRHSKRSHALVNYIAGKVPPKTSNSLQRRAYLPEDRKSCLKC